VKYWVYALCCYRLGLLLEGQRRTEEALKMFRTCLPIYHKMQAREESVIREKIQRLQLEAKE
jgi:hypothetical protein